MLLCKASSTQDYVFSGQFEIIRCVCFVFKQNPTFRILVLSYLLAKHALGSVVPEVTLLLTYPEFSSTYLYMPMTNQNILAQKSMSVRDCNKSENSGLALREESRVQTKFCGKRVVAQAFTRFLPTLYFMYRY